MTMQARHLMNLLQDHYTTIEVVFSGEHDADEYEPHRPQMRKSNAQSSQQTYTYKAPKSYALVVGDKVIVDSPSVGYTVVTVVNVHPMPRIDINAKYTYKWIVQKVDDSEYRAQMARELEFLDSLAEAERASAREKMVQEALSGLPDGTAGRQLFQAAVEKLRQSSVNLQTLGHEAL